MDKRTEYVERLSVQMIEWDAQIDRLRTKATGATPEEGLDYLDEIAALQTKRDEAARKLQNMAAAGDDEWEALKTGTEETWGELITMLGDAINKIK